MSTRNRYKELAIYFLMLTLIILSIYLLFIFLTLWTISSYSIKKETQNYIQEKLKEFIRDLDKVFLSLELERGIMYSILAKKQKIISIN